MLVAEVLPDRFQPLWLALVAQVFLDVPLQHHPVALPLPRELSRRGMLVLTVYDLLLSLLEVPTLI